MLEFKATVRDIIVATGSRIYCSIVRDEGACVYKDVDLRIGRKNES